MGFPTGAEVMLSWMLQEEPDLSQATASLTSRQCQWRVELRFL